jgi:hypothetical protein
MLDGDDLSTLRDITPGVLWCVAYVLIIRRGFLDRSYGMPLPALCANLAYEFVFAFVLPLKPPTNYVCAAWCLIDAVIAYQYLRFGRKELAEEERALLIPTFLLGMATAAIMMITITKDLGLALGNSYAGWGCQLLLSIALIHMLLRRPDLAGQSIYIALARFLGSVATIPAQEAETGGVAFLRFVYVAFMIYDVIYIVLYVRKARALGINPWRRL